MKFDKVIKKRRSTREYSSKLVKDKDIEKLIEAARLSPSAANRQPWKFVILKGSDKNKIADIMNSGMKEEDIKNIMKKVGSATKSYSPSSSVVGSIKVIKEAPVLILVFREANDDWLEGDYLSIGCACEHICLKATDLKLASLWIRDVIYKREEIEKSLGYESMQLVTGITIGYSIEHPYKVKRKNLHDIMTWYKSDN